MPLDQKDLEKHLSVKDDNWDEYAANLPDEEIPIVDNFKYKRRHWYSKWWGILLILIVLLILVWLLFFISLTKEYIAKFNDGSMHYYMLHKERNWGVQADMSAIVQSADDQRWGNENAKVVLVEFADYTCPACQSFNNEIMPKLMQDYADKILFIYRDNPIMSTGAGESLQIANLSNCIHKNLNNKDDYWKVHNYIYLMGENTLNIHNDFDGYYDVKSVQSCVDNQDLYNEVLDDYYVADQLGLTATPIFYINGNIFYGSSDYAEWQYVLDQYLNYESAN